VVFDVVSRDGRLAHNHRRNNNHENAVSVRTAVP
jgi:hypothetical protein